MNTLVKIVLIFVVAVSLEANANRKPKSCAIKSATSDYKEYFNIATDINFNVLTHKVDKSNTTLVLLADKLSCGSKGCDYLLYEELEAGCFRRLADFSGHVKILEGKKSEYPVIWVGVKKQAVEKSFETQFYFDPTSEAYVEIKKSRKSWNGFKK